MRARRYSTSTSDCEHSCTQTRLKMAAKTNESRIISWVVGLPAAIIWQSEPTNLPLGGCSSRQSRCWRSYCSLTACSTKLSRIKIAKEILAMKIRKRDTVCELVTVHKRKPINRVIDEAAQVEDTFHDFDKSVKAAEMICGFSTKRWSGLRSKFLWTKIVCWN